MDILKLKNLLIENKIYIDDKSKNFICRCYLCGDHPNPKKHGHLWVSKNPLLPIAHCFFCNKALPITKLISDITGNKELYKEIYNKEELEKQNRQEKTSIKNFKNRYQEYKIPDLNIEKFPNKSIYIKERINNLIDVDKIPNLIFDFNEFITINNLKIVGDNNIINNFEIDILQNKFIAFLGNHNTILYCRTVDKNDSFKFKKIQIQIDNLCMSEYYGIKNNYFSNTIVLTEGNFNILSEYLCDSLNIKDKVKIYASCNGFNYSSVLKSICYDENLYQPDVIILSDKDKPKHWYRKFLKENNHIIKSCKIFMNRSGKDFNNFPLIPFEVF